MWLPNNYIFSERELNKDYYTTKKKFVTSLFLFREFCYFSVEYPSESGSSSLHSESVIWASISDILAWNESTNSSAVGETEDIDNSEIKSRIVYIFETPQYQATIVAHRGLPGKPR